jgi:hypothetical protein
MRSSRRSCAQARQTTSSSVVIGTGRRPDGTRPQAHRQPIDCGFHQP